eukprot:Polyplicarium_translucidae@DN3304_c1_g1_i4.p1
MVSLSPLLAFNEAPFLTLPSVVYDSAGDRWVMTLSGASDSNGNQPTFYHSADGTDDWTAGGLFVPPAVEAEDGGPPHFRPFTNNFLVPMDGKWVMMGTPGTTSTTTRQQNHEHQPVFFIGELDDTTAVFESDYTNRGRPLFSDFAARPFPVWNHEVHRHVMMNVMDPLVDDSPYKPLSLPVWFEPAVGTSEGIDYGECLRSDWIDAVKSRIENGPPGGDVGNHLNIRVPEEKAYDVLVVNVTAASWNKLEVRTGPDTRAFDVMFADRTLTLRRTGVETTQHFNPFHEDEMTLSLLIDYNLVEINLNGWTLRVMETLEIADQGVSAIIIFGTEGVRPGWTLGVLTPAEPQPPTTTTTRATSAASSTTGTTTPSGSGGTRAKTGVALALLVVCFFR